MQNITAAGDHHKGIANIEGRVTVGQLSLCAVNNAGQQYIGPQLHLLQGYTAVFGAFFHMELHGLCLTGAAVSVHTIADGQAEAMEFLVEEGTKNCGVPLKQMKLRSNVLLASITRGSQTEIPGGYSFFQKGDTIVVVTSGQGTIRQLNDIFA